MDKIFAYFGNFTTVRYAALAVILISVCSAMLGVCLVLKRYSMIGDGLSHVSFGTTAIATVLGLTSPIYIALPVTAVSAVLLLKLRSSTGAKGDSAIAMISSGALAFGYLALNLFGESSDAASSDACATLFGSGIIGIELSDVILCIILSAVILLFFALFYNKIFSVTFDEDFATATGQRAALYNTVISIVTAVTVVISMNMLGALLASALVVFPALSAMRLFKSFKAVTVFAVLLSLLCGIVGILISLAASTAVGPTVVTADLCAFLLCLILGAVRRKA